MKRKGGALLKIYTKKGDKGETQLIGRKVKKTDSRVAAYGTVDELNSFVGVAINMLQGERYRDIVVDLQKIQHELFDLGGDLANVTKEKQWALRDDDVTYLEKRIDELSEELPQLRSFILPGGEVGASYLHVCRTVTRRCERAVLSIQDDDEVSQVSVKYLNRLSDYFFVAARVVNVRNNRRDILYERK